MSTSLPSDICIMYCGNLLGISWNDVHCDSFPVKNCVKQGVVINPALFSINIDKLLYEFESNGIGYFIGKCVLVNWHMLTILRLMLQCLVQCVACFPPVIDLLIVFRLN